MSQAGRMPPLWKGSTKRIGQMMCGAIAQSTSRSISDSRTSLNS